MKSLHRISTMDTADAIPLLAVAARICARRALPPSQVRKARNLFHQGFRELVRRGALRRMANPWRGSRFHDAEDIAAKAAAQMVLLEERGKFAEKIKAGQSFHQTVKTLQSRITNSAEWGVLGLLRQRRTLAVDVECLSLAAPQAPINPWGLLAVLREVKPLLSVPSYRKNAGLTPLAVMLDHAVVTKRIDELELAASFGGLREQVALAAMARTRMPRRTYQRLLKVTRDVLKARVAPRQRGNGTQNLKMRH